MIQRFRTWWIDRRTRRRWQRLSPDRQLAMFISGVITAMDQNRDLRRAMRRAMRVRGYDGE
jgi:hypothetical protein